MKMMIGFSKSKKRLAIGSYVIRMYQNTEYSHTYIRVKSNKSGRSDHILHASEGLVQHMSGTQFDKKHIVVKEFEVQVTIEKLKEVKDVMHELSGADYNIIQNVGIVLVDLLSLVGIKYANPWKKGWNCSEYVLRVLQEIDNNAYIGIDPDTVTPKDIYKLLKLQKEDIN